MSGIGLDTEVITAYQDCKKDKTHTAFLILAIQNEEKVVVEKKVMKDEVPALLEEAVNSGFKKGPHETDKYALLRSILIKSPPRYAVIIAEYDDQGPKTKVTFITWCSDNSKVKERMLISSTKENIIKKLEGATAYQASDESDLEYKSLCDGVSKGKATWN